MNNSPTPFFNTVDQQSNAFQQLLLREGKTAEEFQREIIQFLELQCEKFHGCLTRLALVLPNEQLTCMCGMKEFTEEVSNAINDISEDISKQGWTDIEVLFAHDSQETDTEFIEFMKEVAAISEGNRNTDL